LEERCELSKGMTRDQKLHRQHLLQRKGSNGKRQFINFVWEKKLYLIPEICQMLARMIELWIDLYFNWENRHRQFWTYATVPV